MINWLKKLFTDSEKLELCDRFKEIEPCPGDTKYLLQVQGAIVGWFPGKNAEDAAFLASELFRTSSDYRKNMCISVNWIDMERSVFRTPLPFYSYHKRWHFRVDGSKEIVFKSNG